MRRLALLTSDSLRLRSGQAGQVGLLFFDCLLTRAALILTSLFWLLTPVPSPAQGITPQSILTTVAGGSWIFRGDSGPATSVLLDSPIGVAVDATGNFHIAGRLSNRIRQVSFTPAVGGVVNGASFANLPPPAGSIGSIFGTNLAFSTLVADSTPLPTSLGGVSVQINGIAAPLFFVSPLQINFQVPWESLGLPEGSITVTVNGVTSAPQTISLAPFHPGIFATNSAGTGQGAILIAATGEFAAPSGSIPDRAARLASRGDFLSIFCTGLGAVRNPPVSGAPALAEPLSTTITTPSVTIGGVPASVSFSGLGPGFVGLYQVNVEVPEDALTGNAVPVVLTIGGVTSNTVTIAVQ